MPNVTYIKFDRAQNTWHSFTNTSNFAPGAPSVDGGSNNTNTGKHNLTSDVILLIEESHRYGSGSRLFHGSSFAIGVVVCAFLTLLFGCCCACNWYNQTGSPSNGFSAHKKQRHRQRHHQRTASNGNTNTHRNSVNMRNISNASVQQLVQLVLNYRSNRSSGNSDLITDMRGFSASDTTNTSMDSTTDSMDHSWCGAANTTFGEYYSNNRENNRDRRRRQLRNSCVHSANGGGDSYIDIDNNEGRREHQSSDQQSEIIRRYDLDVESLPSYTLVSGLPTYDDALEQFRKPGIIISSPDLMKLFENCNTKPAITDSDQNATANDNAKADQESELNPEKLNVNMLQCRCETTSSSAPATPTSTSVPTITITSNPRGSISAGGTYGGNNVTQVIELSPDQLSLLSQKRLSVQISFSSPAVGRTQPSTPNVKSSDTGKLNQLSTNDFPLLHGCSPNLSLQQHRRASDCLRNSINIRNMQRNSQHRGSLG